MAVPVVGRWIACRPDGPWFIVDWAEGRGFHQLANRLHLHPDVQIDRIEATRVVLRLGSDVVQLGALGRE